MSELASRREHTVGAPVATVGEAVQPLVLRGFVRVFEARNDGLWCESCGTAFRPERMVVEWVTPVVGGTLLALRDLDSGAAGTWLVVRPTGRERTVLARFQWARRTRHPGRAGRQRPPARTTDGEWRKNCSTSCS